MDTHWKKGVWRDDNIRIKYVLEEERYIKVLNHIILAVLSSFDSKMLILSYVWGISVLGDY